MHAFVGFPFQHLISCAQTSILLDSKFHTQNILCSSDIFFVLNCILNVGVMLILDLVEFTDEEGYGKYLDLHECYVKFINLKGIEVQFVDY